MTPELTILGWTLVLALAQLIAYSALRSKETGIAYTLSPRDEPSPPIGIVSGRLQRAHINLLETLPVFIGAILIVHVTGREGPLTLWGAWLYLIARIAYVPLYALGVPYLRSLAFQTSLAGLTLLLIAILKPL